MNGRLALSLFVSLAALYFAVFTGHPVSGDERLLFDMARSLTIDGTFELALSTDQRPAFDVGPHEIMPSANVEPLQAYLSAPLVLLARYVPEIGVMHTVWLFNIFVTALTAALLYAYGLHLGYRQRTAALTALIFGLATIALPYTQMYFREPLLALCGLAAAYFTERWYAAPRRFAWLIAAFGAALAATLTKQAGAVFVIAPLLGMLSLVMRQRRAWYILLIGATFAVGIIALRWESTLGRFLTPERLERAAQRLPEALPAYLISPGFSLWAFSPILLAGLIGAAYLWREGRFRVALLPLAVLLGFAVGHPILHSDYWYGGLGWGPRFLVPTTPFLCLWLLPIVESFFGRMRRVGKVGFIALLTLSAAVQLIAISLPPTRYGAALAEASQREGRPIVAWREGVWDLRYQPILVTLQQIGSAPSAVAWDVLHVGGVILPLCALSLALALIGLRRRVVAWLSLAALIGTLYIGLRAVYPDPRYGGDDSTLWSALRLIEATLKPGDVLIVNSDAYRPFIANYYKRGNPAYVIPTPEGETVDPDNPPRILSANPEARANPYFQSLFARLAERSQRWLFLTEYTPFTPNRHRVTEEFLARHYFPAQELFSAPTARLLTFAPIGAPPMRIPPFPKHTADVPFGMATLIGFDLPRGTRYRAGDFLPISLLWRAEGFPSDLDLLDYSVNLSLIDANGFTVAQRVAQPRGTFGGFTIWQAGALYRDHHALQLPADLPAGTYELWLLLTDWRDGSALPLRNGSGDRAVLVTVEIEPKGDSAAHSLR